MCIVEHTCKRRYGSSSIVGYMNGRVAAHNSHLVYSSVIRLHSELISATRTHPSGRVLL